MFSILVGLHGCYFIIKKDLSKEIANDFMDFSWVLIIISLIGARLFYVIGLFDYYKKCPQEIIMINHGGISIYGAVVFGIMCLFFYSKIKKISFLKFADCIALIFPLSQAIGRWGNYFNQEAFGAPSNSFIRLFVDYRYRPIEYVNIDFYHPAFLYEFVLDLALFFILVFIFLKIKNLKYGTIFCLYMIGYGIIRIIVEYFRIDSVLYIFNLPVAQVISFVVIVIAIIKLYQIYKK